MPRTTMVYFCNMADRGRFRAQGFTLIELMIVVVIIGVLAAIAIPTFTNYVYKARTSEAVTFLGEIRQRQESYYAEFGRYAAAPDRAASGGWGDFTPSPMPDADEPVSWPDVQAWQELGARPDGLVRFQYATVAGGPGQDGPAGTNIEAPGRFWYAAQARGDLDGNGDAVTFEVYYRGSQIWVSEAKGWE